HWGQMLKKKAYALMKVGIYDDVIIFQGQNAWRWYVGQVIEQSSEHNFLKMRIEKRLLHGMEQGKGFATCIVLKALTSSHKVAPEANRIIVATFQRDPGYDWSSLFVAQDMV